MDESLSDLMDRLENRGYSPQSAQADIYLPLQNWDCRDNQAEQRSVFNYRKPGGHNCSHAPATSSRAANIITDGRHADEQISSAFDCRSRQGQASLGRARSYLPPTPIYDHSHSEGNSIDHYELPLGQFRHIDKGKCQRQFSGGYADSQVATRLHLSPLPQIASSSSGHAMSSSPTFSASQRQQPQAVSQAGMHYQENGSSYQFIAPVPPTISGNPYCDDQITRPRNPIVQGIELLSVRELPDRFRSVFSFPLFNAVQSKCFVNVYRGNDNFVLSSPTGSGKTAIFELAICRLLNVRSNGSFKIVYMAPMKSLCSERKKDWERKFSPLNLRVEELTGDSDATSLRAVQNSDVIVTTPEKWDSMTRKWKDHEKLVQLVKLFLIDEVHILNKDRGATLEAVVSRMKSVGSDIRIIALSATLPNSQDIATWLGRDSSNQEMPAIREKFGEEHRPVKLQKHVCGYQSRGNDYAFDSLLNNKVPEVITKYSHHKPVMIFCFTRKSCKVTAECLAKWWITSLPQNRYWDKPRRPVNVQDESLRELVRSGIAIHHAGIAADDRASIETAFLEGNLSVICCTSTLAVGVNLPCQMVIIKNTVSWEGGSGQTKEYSDLEIMQMMGRAGRPQFDDSAVAVIMTRMSRTEYYQKMVTGQEVLESRLHLNIIEHLNAEIGLGTITSLQSAKRWLRGTFMYVRLKSNPENYQIQGDAAGRDLDERLERICNKGIESLEEYDLVECGPSVKTTAFGQAMARYYVNFETMKVLLALPPKPKISEILSSLAQGHEFRELRLRAGEKQLYKEVNKSPSLRFPIKVDLALPAHKVSLILQSVLGGIDTISQEQNDRLQYNIDQTIIFQHARRLIRCVVDCQSYVGDSIGIRNALMLVRSLGARVWDDSPLHIQQLVGIGTAAVKRLIGADMKSIEDLANTEPYRIETILSRNPPFGTNLLRQVRDFPKLRISVNVIGESPAKSGSSVTLKVKADFGFLNEKVPSEFQRKMIYICILAEISDGQKLHFGRISAKKLGEGQTVMFEARLTNPHQSINCYVACEEIAGTSQQASVKPDVPLSMFPTARDKSSQLKEGRQGISAASRSSEAKAHVGQAVQRRESSGSDLWDDGIDDADLADAIEVDTQYKDIEEFEDVASTTHGRQVKLSSENPAARGAILAETSRLTRKLPNGKWACNHTCKDKSKCRHLCCKEGMDSIPKLSKPAKSKKSQIGGSEVSHTPKGRTQARLGLPGPKLGVLTNRTRSTIEQVDLSHSQTHPGTTKHLPSTSTIESLSKLHRALPDRTLVHGMRDKEPEYSYAQGTQPTLSFLEGKHNEIPSKCDSTSSGGPSPLAGRSVRVEAEDNLFDDLPSLNTDNLDETGGADHQVDSLCQDDLFRDFPDNDEKMLEDALVGAEDSHNLASDAKERIDGTEFDGDAYQDWFGEDSVLAGSYKNKDVAQSLPPGQTLVPEIRPSIFMADSSGISGTGRNEHGAERAFKRRIEQMENVEGAPAKHGLYSHATKRPRNAEPHSDEEVNGRDNTIAETVKYATSTWTVEDTSMIDTAIDSPRTTELKAFLLAEFGDSVELV